MIDTKGRREMMTEGRGLPEHDADGGERGKIRKVTLSG